MNKETINKLQKLGTKYDIKEANGIDGSKEIHEMLVTLGSTIDNSDGHVDAFISKTESLALSLIDEPLSDIPTGRIMQLIPIMKREYNCFKDVCNNYMNGNKDIFVPMIHNQFDRFYAISEFTATAFRNLGDHKTTYLEEFDKRTQHLPSVINVARINDKESLFVAINNWFDAYDILLDVIKSVFETKNMEQFNPVAIAIGSKNLYMNCVIRELELQ